jgi:hypothetical protein
MAGDPLIIVSAEGGISAAGSEVMEAIAEAAQATIRAQRDRVEQLVLEGSNEVRVKGLGVKEYVYTVPDWHKAPIVRLRVEWRRWCWRRAGR